MAITIYVDGELALTTTQASQRTHRTPETVRQIIARTHLKPIGHLDRRTPLYRAADVDAWRTPTRTPSEQSILEAATQAHDNAGCDCDRRYLTSCPNLAAAILNTLKETP